MADTTYLQILAQGVDDWNKWREKNPEAEIDLSGAELEQWVPKQPAFQTAKQLAGINFSKVNLQNAILKGLVLEDADFSQARLDNADLTKVNFTKAKLPHANMTGAVLYKAEFRRSEMPDALLADADLSSANFEKAYMPRANLNQANAGGANFSRADMAGAILTDAVLSGALVSGADLRHADFSGADLRDVDLPSAQAYLPAKNLLALKGFPREFPIDVAATIFADLLRSGSLTEEVTATIGAMDKKLDEFRSEIDREISEFRFTPAKISEMGDAVAKLEAALPTLGVRSQAASFEQLVNRHRKAAWSWLVATIVAFGFTVWFAVSDYRAIEEIVRQGLPTVPPTLLLGKLLIYSLMSLGIVWAGKNYRSERHNQATNQHRATALITYTALIQGSASEPIKDALLMLATDAMYRDRPTGFDSGEGDTKQINPIVGELIRAATRPGSGTPDGKV